VEGVLPTAQTGSCRPAGAFRNSLLGGLETMRTSVATLRIAVLVCAALGAGSGYAQADPARNSSGIFFDEGAYDYCQETEVGGTVTAYVCLTRLTAPSGIVYWEGSVQVSPGGSFLGLAPRGPATNHTAPPEFKVEFSEPLPYLSSLVVLELTVLVSDIHPVALRFGPASEPSVTPDPWPLPAYAPAADPTNLRTVGYSFGWNPATGVPNWCAIINPAGGCPSEPLPRREATWGGVKALYR
jgi:hypothetical protein